MSAAPAVEKDLFHMLLEIERHFRAEERKDLGSKRWKITPKFFENNQEAI
jgi:hypothetical protein